MWPNISLLLLVLSFDSSECDLILPAYPPTPPVHANSIPSHPQGPANGSTGSGHLAPQPQIPVAEGPNNFPASGPLSNVQPGPSSHVQLQSPSAAKPGSNEPPLGTIANAPGVPLVKPNHQANGLMPSSSNQPNFSPVASLSRGNQANKLSGSKTEPGKDAAQPIVIQLIPANQNLPGGVMTPPSRVFPDIPVCEQPRQTGQCKARFERYFYNKTEHACKQFVYGGCNRNDNNFEDIEECIAACLKGNPGAVATSFFKAPNPPVSSVDSAASATPIVSVNPQVPGPAGSPQGPSGLTIIAPGGLAVNIMAVPVNVAALPQQLGSSGGLPAMPANQHLSLEMPRRRL